jgi:hypothetical protein
MGGSGSRSGGRRLPRVEQEPQAPRPRAQSSAPRPRAHRSAPGAPEGHGPRSLILLAGTGPAAGRCVSVNTSLCLNTPTGYFASASLPMRTSDMSRGCRQLSPMPVSDPIHRIHESFLSYETFSMVGPSAPVGAPPSTTISTQSHGRSAHAHSLHADTAWLTWPGGAGGGAGGPGPGSTSGTSPPRPARRPATAARPARPRGRGRGPAAPPPGAGPSADPSSSGGRRGAAASGHRPAQRYDITRR